MRPLPPIPDHLAKRPRDHRGFPIPFVAAWANGKPDFRVVDDKPATECVRKALCALCGGFMPRGDRWFVSGPISHNNRLFLDPAMHKDCAVFALQTCPYLSMPKAHHSNLEKRPLAPGHGVVLIATDKRPEMFYLGRTDGWSRRVVEGQRLIYARPWLEVEQWIDGRRA